MGTQIFGDDYALILEIFDASSKCFRVGMLPALGEISGSVR
jgi:hypothetical protein